MRKAIIIGAGPAGLTAAYELLTRTDIIPILIENDIQVGGLSKTVDYKGNKIDLGGHRFFSKSQKVLDWWLNILPLQEDAGDDIRIRYHNRTTVVSNTVSQVNEEGRMMVRPRKSRIFYRGNFFDYPLQLNWRTARNLGAGKMLLIGLSYLKAKFFPVKPEKSLADFFINRFGKSLYEIFFKDYTEKVWGVSCDSLPATWGQQRIKDLSVSKVIWHAVKKVFSSDKSINQTETSTSLIEQFLYPQCGPGQMWETVAKRVIEMGGTIIMNNAVFETVIGDDCLVKSIKIKNNNTKEVQELSGDYFFSTMPVKELIGGLRLIEVPDSVSKAASSLKYRDFLIVGILASKMAVKDKEDKLTDNWIYIQDKNILAGRMQLFHNWSPYMVTDPTKVWIGVEFFCNETDQFWNETDETISLTAIKEMEQIGLLNKNDVLDTIVVKAPKAYPSYFGGYENFEDIKAFTDTVDNLFLIGRNGMHKYNNSDHSMLTAMTAVDNIITGRKDKSNIWDINTEDEYHEEKS